MKKCANCGRPIKIRQERGRTFYVHRDGFIYCEPGDFNDKSKAVPK